MENNQSAVGFANYLLKTSNDQMVKGIAREYLKLLQEIEVYKKILSEPKLNTKEQEPKLPEDQL